MHPSRCVHVGTTRTKARAHGDVFVSAPSPHSVKHSVDRHTHGHGLSRHTNGHGLSTQPMRICVNSYAYRIRASWVLQKRTHKRHHFDRRNAYHQKRMHFDRSSSIIAKYSWLGARQALAPEPPRATRSQPEPGPLQFFFLGSAFSRASGSGL